ncbi:MAG: hypothetical protein ACKOEH_09695, partial [Actinomycetota bacterium]
MDRFVRAKADAAPDRASRAVAGSTNGEPPSLVVEPMRRAHIRKIMPIEQQVYPRPWTAQVFVEELEQVRAGKRHYLVGTVDEDLVGYGGLLYV